MSDELLTFSAPVDLQAAPDEGKRPTFSIHAYTGALMRASGDFKQPIIVDLAGVTTDRPTIPILFEHETSRPLGRGEPVVSAAGIAIHGHITGDDADSQKVITHAKNGFEWQASIGGTVGKREFLAAGKTAVVNGRQIVGPAVIAREFLLKETSFLAIGADSGTSAAVAASLSSEKEVAMKFEEWVAAKGMDIATLTDPVKTYLKAQFDAEGTPPSKPAPNPNPNPVPPENPRPRPQGNEDYEMVFARSERRAKRRSEIIRKVQEAVEECDNDPEVTADIRAVGDAAMLDLESDPRDFELALMRVKRGKPPVQRRGGQPAAQKRFTNEILSAALCKAGRLPNIDKHFSDQTLSAADKALDHQLGLAELLLICAKDASVDVVTLKSEKAIERMLQGCFSRELRAAEGFSTLSLPNILANTQNKIILESFMAVEAAWRPIAAIASLSDFKPTSVNSLVGDLTLKELGPAGQIKHGTLAELNYTNQVRTFARILAITRQDIINDDMNAFMQVPRRLGRGGALAINLEFWTKFMNNATFFTSARGNYDDGTDTVLDAAGLERAITLYDALTDPDGNPLGATLRTLLVPPGQYISALELMTSAGWSATGDANLTQIPQRNVFAGMFNVVKSQYLSNANIPGFSNLAYYLLADPSDIPVIQLGFLNGREMPIVETADADFESLGIKVRAYHDFGAALMEWRGGIKFKGEA